MRNLFRTLALAAVAAVGAVSCTENVLDDTINPETEGVTLYANTPPISNTSTKVGFEDKVGDGIALTWEDGDSFTLYDGKTKIDDFTTNGDDKFTSSRTDLKLVEKTVYTAKYNETVDLSEQDGDKIDNLNDACQMEATFIYGVDETINFDHTKAIMTFKFKSVDRPAYLEFKNGDDTYKVTYSELEPDGDGIYTSHIMIEPCEATKRTLTFSLYNSSDEAYDVRMVESSRAYKVGNRYTSPISDLDAAHEDTNPIVFKDSNFKDALLAIDNIDANNDDEITYGEAKAFNGEITIRGNEQITSMNEMKYFTSITKLTCIDNSNLTALDVSKNVNLEKLLCYNNKLETLNLEGCMTLTTLYCNNNTSFKTLNVADCTALKTLLCHETSISELDVSNCKALEKLWCYETSISTLDLSSCEALKELHCYETSISTLDLSNCKALKFLICYNSSITELTLPKSTSLITFDCYNNRLKSLDISGYPDLFLEVLKVGNQTTDGSNPQTLTLTVSYDQLGQEIEQIISDNESGNNTNVTIKVS